MEQKPETPVVADAGKPRLDYAPRTPLAIVGRHGCLLICLALAIAIGAPLWWFWQPLKQRVMWLYWFHQAAAFRMPDTPEHNEVWYPIPPRQVPTTRPEFQLETYFDRGYQFAMARYLPRPYQELRKIDPRFFPPGSDDMPLAFMGTLKRPDGAARLVVVFGGRGLEIRIMGSVYATVLPAPGLFDPLP
jgi:hypothetical protein